MGLLAIPFLSQLFCSDQQVSKQGRDLGKLHYAVCDGMGGRRGVFIAWKHSYESDIWRRSGLGGFAHLVLLPPVRSYTYAYPLVAKQRYFGGYVGATSSDFLFLFFLKANSILCINWLYCYIN